MRQYIYCCLHSPRNPKITEFPAQNKLFYSNIKKNHRNKKHSNSSCYPAAPKEAGAGSQPSNSLAKSCNRPWMSTICNHKYIFVYRHFAPTCSCAASAWCSPESPGSTPICSAFTKADAQSRCVTAQKQQKSHCSKLVCGPLRQTLSIMHTAIMSALEGGSCGKIRRV